MSVNSGEILYYGDKYGKIWVTLPHHLSGNLGRNPFNIMGFNKISDNNEGK